MVISLRDSETLEVSFRYDKRLVEAVKALPVRAWDKDQKQWLIPLEYHVELLQIFQNASITYDAWSAISEWEGQKVRWFVESMHECGILIFDKDGELMPVRSDGRDVAPLLVEQVQGRAELLRALDLVDDQIGATI